MHDTMTINWIWGWKGPWKCQIVAGLPYVSGLALLQGFALILAWISYILFLWWCLCSLQLNGCGFLSSICESHVRCMKILIIFQGGMSFTMRNNPFVSRTRYRWPSVELARLTILLIPLIYFPTAITKTCAPAFFNCRPRYNVFVLCVLDWPSVRIKTRFGTPRRAPLRGLRMSLVHLSNASCVFLSPPSKGISLTFSFSMAFSFLVKL